MPNIKQHFLILDGIVENVFIPGITEGHTWSKDERLLLSLPVKKGGLAIPIFLNAAKFEFTNSGMATEQLVVKIKNQDSTSPVDGEQRGILLKPEKIVTTLSYNNYMGR